MNKLNPTLFFSVCDNKTGIASINSKYGDVLAIFKNKDSAIEMVNNYPEDNLIIIPIYIEDARS